MPSNPANSSYSSLLATTLNIVEGQMHDAISVHNPFLKLLRSEGYERTLDGRPYITHRIMNVENPNFQFYTGDDEFSTILPDAFSVAQFSWKQAGATAGITGIDRFKNSGSKAKVSDLMSDIIANLKTTFRKKIAASLFSDGTGYSSKEITGLQVLVEDGAAWSQVGGIDSNTWTFWRNQYAGTVGSFAANGEGAMLTMVNNCHRDEIGVGLIITDQTTYESYHNSGVRLTRIVNQKMLNLGFTALEFQGIPVYYDANCTSGYMYFLSPDTFYWNLAKGFDMKSLPAVRPNNQDVETQLVIMYCNLSVGNRARNGVLTGITNP